MKKKFISIVMIFVMILSSTVTCQATGKTATGLENNKVSGTSDAQSFVRGIKAKDSNYSSFDVDSANVSVVPIVMAEVSMDGNPEKETIVAYDVTIKNTYDGIEIQGDYLSGVVSNTSTSYLAGNWNKLKKVKVGNNRKSVVDYNTAVNKVAKQFGSSTRVTNSIGSMNNGKLAFVYNDKTGYYEPNWVFESEKEAVTYNVNCLSGALNIVEMPK